MADGELVDLAVHQVLDRIAKSARVSTTDAVRLLRAIASAPVDDGDEVVGWVVREQHRLLRAAEEKRAARVAAVAEVRRRDGR